MNAQPVSFLLLREPFVPEELAGAVAAGSGGNAQAGICDSIGDVESAVIAMGCKLRLRTVAEGIATRARLRSLTGLCCSEGQGDAHAGAVAAAPDAAAR